MTPYQRIAAALRGEMPDRVPVMLHNFMMAAREIGVTMDQFRSDARVMADAFIRSVETYELDGIMIDVDTVTLAGALGARVQFPEDEPAVTTGGRLESLADVRRMGPPNVENYAVLQNWLEATRLIKEHFGDEVYVRGNCDQAPFTLAGMVRGSAEWMVDLATTEDESILFELLDYCAEASIQFLRLMAQTGADMVSNGDSPAGPELISPRMYRRFALPYEQRMAQEAHNLGLPYALHICGNTERILSDMVEVGADAYELDYKTDTRKVHEVLHDRATLIGNIDPSGVLALGSPDTVRKATLDLLQVFGNSPRFILNAGCALPATTPPQNLRTLIETARSFR